MKIQSTNPATGQTIARYELLNDSEIEGKLSLAATAFREHRKTSFAERREKLRRVADILDAECERFGALMTEEMGKTYKSGMAEAQKSAIGCRYYADRGEGHLADELIGTNASKSFIRYQPLGAVLAVMPWNFPFWQVFRFAAPALMAGNVGLLKHASNVPGCALAIEEILLRAGFAPGVFQTLLIGPKQVERLIEDPRVAAVTLTGSEPTGQSVASRAGQQIKRCVLELGGSDPFIVMPSVEMTPTVEAAVSARTVNNGQSCIAAKRFIVADQIYDEFERQFVARMNALRVGDPVRDTTEVGPLATAAIRDELHEQVMRAQQAGARVLTGGEKLPGPGFYYKPTALAGVTTDNPVYGEELFGPVAMLFRVKDREQALELANATSFGLGSSVWTNDESEAEFFIDGIEAGQVFVNGPVVSDPRLPFGGVKRSGYGRELSAMGIREFVNAKTVWCK